MTGPVVTSIRLMTVPAYLLLLLSLLWLQKGSASSFGDLIQKFDSVDGELTSIQDENGHLFVLDRWHTLTYFDPQMGAIIPKKTVELPQEENFTQSEYRSLATDDSGKFLYLVDSAFEHNRLVRLDRSSNLTTIDQIWNPAEKIGRIVFNTVTNTYINFRHGHQGVMVDEFSVPAGNNNDDNSLEVIRKRANLPFVENIVWDPVLCSYWAIWDDSETIQRLGWNFQPLESFQVVETSLNLAVMGTTLFADTWFSALDLHLAAYNITDTTSDCTCEKFYSQCPPASSSLDNEDGSFKCNLDGEADRPFCVFDRSKSSYETSTVSNHDEIAEYLRLGGYCGPCLENNLRPGRPLLRIREFGWVSRHNVTLASIENDGEGKLFIVPLYESGSIGKASPIDGRLVENYHTFPPESPLADDDPIQGHIVLTDVAWDGDMLYAIRYMYEDHMNTGRLVQISSNYTTFLKQKNLKPMQPIQITFNTQRGTLMILAKSRSEKQESYQVYEYTREFSLLTQHTVPESLNSLKWDRKLCSYWAGSPETNRILQLDSNFDIVDAIQVDGPELVAPLGSELIVQVVRDRPSDNHFAVVFGVQNFAVQGGCKTRPSHGRPSSNHGLVVIIMLFIALLLAWNCRRRVSVERPDNRPVMPYQSLSARDDNSLELT